MLISQVYKLVHHKILYGKGDCIVTDVQYLEKVISESGKKKDYLASKLGISRQTFYLKCQGKSDFTAPEIKILCNELNITSLKERESIFFAN